ncbi:hypothetical protein B4U79_14241 [Dinothrombium tinctorium]|uniref:Uncharacterized protein n=1 Tax=Dinothrombium tinctorium TaxID=1965070 RepID=A0A3S3QEC7_9ACAR|nr:hypothetical protein B4U79_14241 [Dinothrombium tinctorium]
MDENASDGLDSSKRRSIDCESDAWNYCSRNESNERQSVCQTFDDNFCPMVRLPDSHAYIERLQRKLAKIKGKANDCTSREFVDSIEKIKERTINALLAECPQPDPLSEMMLCETSPSSNAMSSFLERKLFPSKQAISEEELIRLLEADFLKHYLENSSEENKSDE